MILGERTRSQPLAVLTALMIFICFLAGAMLTSKEGNGGPNGGLIPQYATATIKTQKAADAVKGGIRGIDVSQYQGKIDWKKVANDNVKFAMCRASIGQKTDTYFYTNAKGAADNGIAVGAYHYAKFTNRSTMQKEAKYFVSVLKNAKVNYPVVLDLELHQGLNRSTLTSLAVEFMEIVEKNGYTVMFYSYTNFIKDRLDTSKMKGYDFWVANYMEEPKINQVMWQHTSKGRVSGISGDVDINIAYKDLSLSKKVTVSKSISSSIKATMNERHGSGLPEDGANMAMIKEATVRAVQSELNRQLGANLSITGVMDAETLNQLEQVPFTLNETKGNITYLLQVMLFYRGHYTNELNGAYDDYMSDAIESYQRQAELSVTGLLNRDTLWHLLRN